MIFYIISAIIIFATMIDYLNNKKEKYVFSTILFIILFLFSGMRGNIVGSYFYNDTNEYIKIFNNIDTFRNMEVGYIFINRVINMITNNYRVLLLFMSFLTLYFIYKYTKYYSNYFFLAIGIYVILFYYIRDFGQIRASLGYSILIYSTKYICENKKIKFFIGLTIATLIHTSSMLGLAFYFIKDINVDNKILYLILLISFIIFNIDVLNNIQPVLEQYREYFYIDKIVRYIDYCPRRSFDMKVVLYFGIGFISIFFRKYMNNKYYDIKMYSVIIGIFIMSLLSVSEVLSVRGSELFLTFIPLILPDYLDIAKNSHIKWILYNLIVIFLIGYNMIFFKTMEQGLIYR